MTRSEGDAPGKDDGVVVKMVVGCGDLHPRAKGQPHAIVQWNTANQEARCNKLLGLAVVGATFEICRVGFQLWP